MKLQVHEAPPWPCSSWRVYCCLCRRGSGLSARDRWVPTASKLDRSLPQIRGRVVDPLSPPCPRHRQGIRHNSNRRAAIPGVCKAYMHLVCRCSLFHSNVWWYGMPTCSIWLVVLAPRDADCTLAFLLWWLHRNGLAPISALLYHRTTLFWKINTPGYIHSRESAPPLIAYDTSKGLFSMALINIRLKFVGCMLQPTMHMAS